MILRCRASWSEATPLRHFIEFRNRPDNAGKCSFTFFSARHSAQQKPSVRVTGSGKEFLHRTRFDNLSCIHQCHAVGITAHQRQIVRDEQKRNAALLLQILEQIQNLSLPRDIERRRRLIGNHNVRMAGKRHGDHHALLLPAREFMSKRFDSSFWIVEPDARKPLQRPFSSLGLGNRFMQSHSLNDLLAHGHDGIEARCRLLKNHRQASSAYALHLRFGDAQQVASLKEHLATRNVQPLGQQSHKRKRRQRLAAARLSHQRKAFARSNGERHVGDSRQRLASADAHIQIFNVQNFRHGCLTTRGRRFSDQTHPARQKQKGWPKAPTSP